MSNTCPPGKPPDDGSRIPPRRRDPVLALEPFAAALPQRGRLVGLDLGTRTIGIAVSDDLRMVASALTTIRRVKFGKDAAALLALVGEHRGCGLVVGLPVNLDGSEGPRAQATRAFVRNLAPLTELPVLMWDERLSTVEAERMLIAADASRRRRAEVIDQVAATLILQTALDRIRRADDARTGALE